MDELKISRNARENIELIHSLLGNPVVKLKLR